MGGAGTSMAAANSLVLGDLLRLAISSVEGNTFYLCAACNTLQQEKDVKRANEELLASLLQQLEREIATFSRDGFTASSACEDYFRGGEELEEEEGNETGWGGREDERGVWAAVVQLYQGVAELCASEKSPKALLGFISNCLHFQTSCNHFLLATLAVGWSCGVLRGECLGHFLEQFHEQFWSSQIDQFAKRVGCINPFVIENKTSVVDGFYSCLKHVSLLHILQEMQRTLIDAQDTIFSCQTSQTSLHGDRSRTTLGNVFLCEAISNPLATELARAVPQVLHAVYQAVWSSDRKMLTHDRKIPTTNKDGVGLILKVGGAHYVVFIHMNPFNTLV